MLKYDNKYFEFYVVVDDLIYSGFHSRIDAMIRYERAKKEGFTRLAILTRKGLEERGIDPKDNDIWLQQIIQKDEDNFIDMDVSLGDYDDNDYKNEKCEINEDLEYISEDLDDDEELQ